MAISLIALVIFIALIVLLVTGMKVQVNEGGEDMIKNVYVYLVLFATLMMTIGGSVGVFMAAADIIAPQPYYQSFEDYSNQYNVEKEKIQRANLSDQELRTNYEAIVSAEKDRQLARAKNSMIKSLGWIIIPFPVYLLFQRRLAGIKANNSMEGSIQ